MRKNIAATLAATAVAATLAGCAGMDDGRDWTRLVDGGAGYENFIKVGEADWSVTDGALQAAKGGKDPAYLLSKASYKDFIVRAEFWASDDANSGLFVRCQNPAAIGDETCYEANIFDQRPDQTYATGAIVKVAAVRQPAPKAGGKWNTMEVTAQGDRLVVVLNGEKTVDVVDKKFASGPLALQWGRGTIKFRKVEIKAL